MHFVELQMEHLFKLQVCFLPSFFRHSLDLCQEWMHCKMLRHAGMLMCTGLKEMCGTHTHRGVTHTLLSRRVLLPAKLKPVDMGCSMYRRPYSLFHDPGFERRVRSSAFTQYGPLMYSCEWGGRTRNGASAIRIAAPEIPVRQQKERRSRTSFSFRSTY